MTSTTPYAFRTPETRFENLPGYDFAPRYVEVDGLRMHYIDEGPQEGAPVVCFHGEPTWAFLYRKMVGPLVAAGHRRRLFCACWFFLRIELVQVDCRGTAAGSAAIAVPQSLYPGSSYPAVG